MNSPGMTSMERVLTTLGHKEPDRVPLFLLVTLLGARELGLPIQEYFSRAENVVEGELRLWRRYKHDCVSSFFYAGLEIEAWGGETFFRDDGPPTTSRFPITDMEAIAGMEPPRVADSPRLMEVLKATRLMSEQVAGEAPVIGIAMSPFSLPVIQMGFDRYIEMMFQRPDLFNKLMRINEDFCAEWCNAMLDAGANAIAYFDPVASTTITSRDMYLKTGFPVAQRTIARINGPVATHMASGKCLPIVGDMAETGTAIIGTSVDEDLALMKEACRGRLTVMGNLNGIEMRNWTAAEAEAKVKEAIIKGAPGGGFILSDNHGEIPWQVSDDVLMSISEAVRRWGRYPIELSDG